MDYETSFRGKIHGPPDVPTAKFEEFWKAYRDGNLVALMDKYGLSQVRMQFHQLESFLREPAAAPRPPVWGLRRYFEFEGMHVDVPANVLTAAHAYGISSGLNARERMQMTAFYKQSWRTLDWNPMEMEEARQKGTLVEHAQSYLQNIEQDVVRRIEKL